MVNWKLVLDGRFFCQHCTRVGRGEIQPLWPGPLGLRHGRDRSVSFHCVSFIGKIFYRHGFYSCSTLVCMCLGCHGSRPGDIALQLLHDCGRNGEWLCLKNLHLVTAWLPVLEKVSIINLFETKKETPLSIFPDSNVSVTNGKKMRNFVILFQSPASVIEVYPTGKLWLLKIIHF